MEYFWKIARSVYSHWGADFQGRYHKMIGYGIMLTLGFFSILDRSVDWENYAHLSDPDFNYALATGSVRDAAKDGLLTFGIIGIIFCVFEIANSVTLMCYGGHVIVPMEIEQGVILLVEQIPQAIINLAVTICHNNFVTSLQAWQCFWGLFNTSLRLYGYGYLKEKIYTRDRGGVVATTRIALYITTSFLWLFLAFGNGFLWHHARLGHMQFNTEASGIKQLEGVSIALVRIATHTRHPENATLMYEEILRESQEKQLPWLVKNIADIARAENKSYTAVYTCRRNSVFFEPDPCSMKNTKAISFKFNHVLNKHKREIQPIGELQYGYAIISRKNDSCYPQKHDLFKDWRLEFYRFMLVPIPYTIHERLQARRAWENVCLIPRLKFNQSIAAC